MRQRNRGGIFISLFGLFGVLLLIAGISMLLPMLLQHSFSAAGGPFGVVMGGGAILIGGAIVFEVIRSQKK